MSKYKDVYNDIKNRIRDGILKPGEFLDSESELANEYSYLMKKENPLKQPVFRLIISAQQDNYGEIHFTTGKN